MDDWMIELNTIPSSLWSVTNVMLKINSSSLLARVLSPPVEERVEPSRFTSNDTLEAESETLDDAAAVTLSPEPNSDDEGDAEITLIPGGVADVICCCCCWCC